MTRKKTQQYRMMTRVVDFGPKVDGRFPEDTIAAALFSDLGTTVGKLTNYSTSQVSSKTSIDLSNAARRKARRTLKSRMVSAAQIADALGIQGFIVPSQPREEELIRVARSFVEMMGPFETQFAEHGLSPQKLNGTIQNLENTLLDRANGKSTRTGSAREFDRLLAYGLSLVARLDAIIQIHLADDELVMAAWKVASTVDSVPSKPQAKVEAPAEPTAEVQPEVKVEVKVEPAPEPKPEAPAAEAQPVPQPEEAVAAAATA